MRNSNHQVWSRTQSVVLNLEKSTLKILTMAAARENLDVEVLAERCISQAFSPDGRAKSNRVKEAEVEAEAKSKRVGLSSSAARTVHFGELAEQHSEATDIDRTEIDRLLRLANKIRS